MTRTHPPTTLTGATGLLSRVPTERAVLAHGMNQAREDWTWVTAAPFRAHVRQILSVTPLPWRAFAGHVSVPDNVLRGLLGLRRRPVQRIAPHYARALISVDAATLRSDLLRPVSPEGALIAARSLLAANWSVADIATVASLPLERLSALLDGQDLLITRRNELLVTAAARAHGHDEDAPDTGSHCAEPAAA
ncbi:hypothetical protein [Granulicoccus sp. GXG6511]|uniref:hypothetical protein n=1 Tax=Granulicoccus sp. GXG6511 TaxID=3381351 RepID=UPI003D7DC8B3